MKLIKSEQCNEKIKPNLKTPFPYRSLFPEVNFTLSFSTYFLQPHRVRNDSWSQFIHCLCCSFLFVGRILHTCSLLQCGVSSMVDNPPHTSSVWVFPRNCSSSITAPAEVPLMECSSSGTDYSNVGPPWGHKSCQQTHCIGFSLQWVHRSCQESAPV